MNAKQLTSAALLLFVGVSVVVLVTRETQKSPAEPAATEATTPADAPALPGSELPESAVVVYYFHGNTRCPTCRDIEEFSHEAITSAFDVQLADQQLQWQVVNYELSENSHYATEYEIVSPTVVLVRTAEGQVADWRNLMRVWELVGDRDAFTTYIQDETRQMLGS